MDATKNPFGIEETDEGVALVMFVDKVVVRHLPEVMRLISL